MTDAAARSLRPAATAQVLAGGLDADAGARASPAAATTAAAATAAAATAVPAAGAAPAAATAAAAADDAIEGAAGGRNGLHPIPPSPEHPQARRPGAMAARIEGRRRARYLATRFGVALKDARTALHRSQGAAARRAGVSQSFWIRLERGAAAQSTIEVLAACASAVDAQAALFIEARSGSQLPRDIEHLRRQSLVAGVAARGGWAVHAEHPIDPLAQRSRSIDLLLERRRGTELELAVVEIEDWLADAGAVFRGLGDKVAAIRRAGTGRSAGLLIVRRTRRNRATITELEAVFLSRFRGSSSDWMRCLEDPGRAMPAHDGWLWSSTYGDRLIVPRRGG